MTSLSRSAFERAANFIVKHARPLDRAQFEYHFGAGSVSSVLDELARFQNRDGGFGHGVEPDVRMPNSSPFVSSVAFQVIVEMGIAAEHQVVKDGIAYFERSYDESKGGWDPTGPHVDEFPHAPWWNYAPVEGKLDDLKCANPGAEIIGYLHSYKDNASDEFVQWVTRSTLRTFERLPDDMEVHVMLCYMRLAEMAPEEVTERLLPKLRRGVHLATGTSSADWAAYGGRPLWFAGTPEWLLADELRDLVPAQLDFEIESQADDGSWKPSWSWGQYEDEWKIAVVEWSGWLTLQNLMAFKAWGRL
ncbi:MAG: hypothetical protein H8D69_01655 [Chloroflexi bacterium]|nr:hypothetical protein [Chloroflexota bacterium]